jgi:hypothetical protein
MMKKLAIFILLLNITVILFGQDILFTINSEKDWQDSYLNSILFENLSNGSSLLFEELPDQDGYIINLSKQTLDITTGILDIHADESFKIVKSIPGEIRILGPSNRIDNAVLSIYNLMGHKIYNQVIDGFGKNTILSVLIPNSGLNIVNIRSILGNISYKVIGSNSQGAISHTLIDNTSGTTKERFNKAPSGRKSNFSFQIGDSIRITGNLDEKSTYPVKLKVTTSDTLTLFFENESGNYIEINSVKYPLNLGYNVWLSELDCGNYDIFAHGLYLTSDISIKKYVTPETGMNLLPSGIGNILVFNMFNKNSTLIGGQYIFVDELDCTGLVTDDGNTYQMNPSDKFVTAVKEMAHPTHYALNVDLDIDWDVIDFNNIPQEIIDQYMIYVNSSVGIKEGIVTLKESGGIYTIKFDCTNSNGIKVTGQFTGYMNNVEFGI